LAFSLDKFFDGISSFMVNSGVNPESTEENRSFHAKENPMAQPRTPSKRKGASGLPARKQIRIDFQDGSQQDEAFGKFCEALTVATTPFTIGGYRAVFMDEKIRAGLTGSPLDTLTDYKKDGIAVEVAVEVTGSRVIRSRDEAKRIAQRYMQGR